MVERRQFVRLREHLTIRYYVIGGGKGTPYQLQEAEVLDSSQGGVRLRTADLLEVGCLVEMEMMLPLRVGAESYKRAVVLGQVVNAKEGQGGEPAEYGVRFVHVDVDMRKEINDFISSRLASSAEVAGES
jgi:c-di-GMP-binding flagellar brake protein YcgR